MGTTYRNVSGSLIMINETGTEIPPDAEFDIDDHPELTRSPQFKRLLAMNFIVPIPTKRDHDAGDPVKILQTGPPLVVPIEAIRQIASEMGAAFKEALSGRSNVDVERLASLVGDHIMQNGGVIADKARVDQVMASDAGNDIEAERAKVMDAALRFQSPGDRPSVSVREELDQGDDLGGAASRLKRTLHRGDA